MSFDLRTVIPDKDKEIMANYFERCGFPKGSILSVDEYLSNWAKNKGKLYRMLGKKLKVEIPIEYEKSTRDMEDSLLKLFRNNDFTDRYRELIGNSDFRIKYKLDYKDIDSLLFILKTYVFIQDEVPENIKIKPEGFKKTLQIQKGMKPMRAFSKIVSYFNEEDFGNFEDFRIKHSIIFNDKKLKGNLVISIHPLDFITMSDNASDWSSCMSWTDDGCYHLGTVEMMNANNVVCCYLDSTLPYYFDDCNKCSEKDEELKKWNNKKWRQLFYINKDIIVSGKSYPYYQESLTKSLLDKIAELAKENFNWTYSFGPELYKDMSYIWSKERMDRNRDWVASGTSLKHNILFDTKNMYNDMLNDNGYKYWCVRNKVKKEKIISYSGPAKCICCNDDLLYEGPGYDYNDRYERTNKVICKDCLREGFCYRCESFVGKDNLVTVSDNGVKVSMCKECCNKYYKVCPECGESFIIPESFNERIVIKLNGFYEEKNNKDYGTLLADMNEYEIANIHSKENTYLDNSSFFAIPGYCCRKCYNNYTINKKENDLIKVSIFKNHWYNDVKRPTTRDICDIYF